MAWIKSCSAVKNHPKLSALAKALNISKTTAIGILHQLWWFAAEYGADGDIGQFGIDEIADACAWQGDASEFFNAIKASGWIDDDGIIHDWKKVYSDAKRASKPKQATPGMKDFTDAWCDAYEARFGAKYAFRAACDGKAAVALMKLVDKEKLVDMAKWAWDDGPRYVKETAVTIAGFLHVFNQVQASMKIAKPTTSVLSKLIRQA